MKKKTGNQFGKYIKRLREEKKMTLRDVEAKSGISTSYLNQLENYMGAMLSDEKVKILARVYGAPPEKFYLLSGRLPPDELAVCIAAREHLEKYHFVNLLEDAVNEKRGISRAGAVPDESANGDEAGISSTEESKERQEDNGSRIHDVRGDRGNSGSGEEEIPEPQGAPIED